MKKIKLLCLVIVVVFSLSTVLGTLSFAEAETEKVLVINSEIRGYDKLLERAKNNINDLDLSKFPSIKSYTNSWKQCVDFYV